MSKGLLLRAVVHKEFASCVEVDYFGFMTVGSPCLRDPGFGQVVTLRMIQSATCLGLLVHDVIIVLHMEVLSGS